MSHKNFEAIYPLSPSQQGMLIQTLSAPESGVFVEQSTWKIHGDFNAELFERAWQRLVDRHAVLRTAFSWTGQDELLQVVLRRVKVPVLRRDWCSLDPVAQRRELGVYLETDRTQGFKPTKAPLMRLALFRLGEDEHRFVWSFHHILMDGWCYPLLVKELFTLLAAYEKGDEPQLEPARPYRDYIRWLKQQDENRAAEFWRKRLRGVRRPTPLGKEVKRTRIDDRGRRYASLEARLPGPTTALLQSLAQRRHVTLSTLIQGVWALLLHRYSGDVDVVFGATVSGRPPTLPGVESMIGLFMNTLPVRITASRHQPLWTWLGEIQARQIEQKAYEYCSTGQVHQWSDMPGSVPLFDSILVFENYPASSGIELPEIKIDIGATRFIGGQTSYALTLIAHAGSELTLQVIYDRERFESPYIDRVPDHFLDLLNNIAARPEQDVATLGARVSDEQILQILIPPRDEKKEPEPGFSAPRNFTEEVLAALLAEAFGVERIGIHDNFFELGGHSLLMIHLLRQIHTIFSVELSVRELFESPNIAGLSELIATAARRGEEEQKLPALGPVSGEEPRPLSYAQERLRFLDPAEGEGTTYTRSAMLRLDGPLQVAALGEAIGEIVRRHQILRTTFPVVEGEARQVVSPSCAVRPPLISLDRLAEDERSTEVHRWVDEDLRRPFDLSTGPMLRLRLLQLAAESHILLIRTHDMIVDVQSIGIFNRELALLYDAFAAGKPSPLPDLPIQYADYAAWQRRWLTGEVLEREWSYWREHLAGAPLSELPTDRPRGKRQTFRGQFRDFRVGRTVRGRLEELSRSSGVTLFMTLLAAFVTLVSRCSGQEDVVIGMPVANRNRKELESLIGLFVNPLVLRTRLEGNPSFAAVLRRVRQVLVEAYAHQDMPFELLLEKLQRDRSASYVSPFRIFFTFQSAPLPAPALHGLTLTPLDLDHDTVKVDLVLAMVDTEKELQGGLFYNIDLFNAETIDSISVRFQDLLQAIGENPKRRLADLPGFFAKG